MTLDQFGMPASSGGGVNPSAIAAAVETHDHDAAAHGELFAALAGRVTDAETAIVKKVDGGTGNVLGGYSVPATAYNATTHVLTLSNAADMTKFHIGESVTVNDLPEDTEEYGAEVWGEYRTAVISVVDADHFTLTLDSDLGLKTSGSLTNIVVRVLDSSRKDASFSSGDRNFVTGDAAGADGLMNTVTGTGAHAGGYGNYVSGDFSDARGVSNVITGNQSFATGGGNKVSGDMSNVAGTGNDVAGQSAQIIGNGNRNITGVDARILGDGNKASGTRAKIVGNQNDVSGDDSTAIGNGIQNAAKKAVVIGQRGELADLPENKGAVAIAGGDTGDGSKAISFIHRARKQDPLDPAETLPAFAHEFLGRLAAIPLRITDVGNIELDHDMYARWELAGTGSVTITLANWIDGDRGELLLDTSVTGIAYPADWVVPSAVSDALVNAPGIHLLEIRQERGTVFVNIII